MGYKTNPEILDKDRYLFEKLEQGLTCSWAVSSGTAERVAWRIRQGLRIAAEHPERYPKLAEMAGKVTIVIVSHRLIVARIAKNSSEIKVSVGEGADLSVKPIDNAPGAKSSPQHGLENYRNTEFPGPQTAESVVEAWNRTQPSSEKLYFPQADLTIEDKARLWAWCQKRSPKWQMILADRSGFESLTLQLRQRDMEEFAWAPTATGRAARAASTLTSATETSAKAETTDSSTLE